MQKEESNINSSVEQDRIRQEIDSIYAIEDRKDNAEKAVFGDDLNGEKIKKIIPSIEMMRDDFLDYQNSPRQKFSRMISGRLFKTDFKQPEMTLKELKERESEIGGSIFGETTDGVSRKFGYDSDGRWVYQENRDDSRPVMLIYEVCENGVMKISNQPGATNGFISGSELYNLRLATENYHQQIDEMIYRDRNIGKKAA